MTATNAAPEAKKPEFWEETGSGFRLSVFSRDDAAGPFYWAEVHPETPGDDSPMLYQSSSVATSETAAALGRAFIAGARFVADDTADAIADAAVELGEEVEIASLSLRVNANTIRRLLGVD